MADIDKINYTLQKAKREEWDIITDEHDSDNNAKRVVLVGGGGITIDVPEVNIGNVGLLDENENPITSANPLPVEGIVGVANASDVLINPATEEKQDAIITAISYPQSFTVRSDDKSINKVLFVGEALPNASESSTVWRIYKLDETGTVSKKLWANGNTNFNNAWSNRLSLTYL